MITTEGIKNNYLTDLRVLVENDIPGKVSVSVIVVQECVNCEHLKVALRFDYPVEPPPPPGHCTVTSNGKTTKLSWPVPQSAATPLTEASKRARLLPRVARMTAKELRDFGVAEFTTYHKGEAYPFGQKVGVRLSS